MAGWNLKSGIITDYHPSEDRIWSLFNFVFSDGSKKRNTYKFGLIKSLLDNTFNGIKQENGIFYTYEELFARFAENYWNLIMKYDLRQMRKDGKSELSRIEVIFKNACITTPVLPLMEFESINDSEKSAIIRKVTDDCKRNVVGALYSDFDGIIYTFDLGEKGLVLSYAVSDFILKYKAEIEKLNYYAWAKFLESINEGNALIRVLEKLELSTPRRSDLSIYREILRKEFEEDTCFYCGKKLKNKVHVDHFIPWSFVKDDKLWNFVLSCPECNIKKNNRLPDREYVIRIVDRNKRIQHLQNQIILMEFSEYTDDLIDRIWHYARRSGLKEYQQ